jgi:flagellar L-ring protein FlgH
MKRTIVMMSVGLFAMVSVAHAESIWDRRDPRAAYLFHDNRARNVGDLMTIAISETTSNNERESRALDKGTQNSGTAAFDGNYQFGGNDPKAGKLDASGSTTTRRRYNGSAQMTSSRSFIDRMAVTIIDVLPNGNLVFEGQRTRVVAGEERVLRLTGVVRPADIGANNTIQSQFIANLKVSYTGRGQSTEFVNQSWLGRALNYFFP